MAKKDRMVTKTNGEVYMALQVLNDKDVMLQLEDLNVAEKLRVAKVFRALNAAGVEYEKKRTVLLDEYANKDEDGKVISDPQTGAADFPEGTPFFEKLQELLDEKNEVELPVLLYGKLRELKLPFRFLDAFDGIFVETYE